MTRADQITAAAVTRVRTWHEIPADDRDAVLAALRRAGLIRECETGGFSVQLGGDPYPTWCPDMSSVQEVVAEHMARPTSVVLTP